MGIGNWELGIGNWEKVTQDIDYRGGFYQLYLSITQGTNEPAFGLKPPFLS
ncbi:MAG: hypothetical protein QQW96_17355 [Tychonema bourrellyi B0820]|nr:hypothetical protein [Tychonema bourrellyi B0820]